MAIVIQGKNDLATTLSGGSYTAKLYTSDTVPAEGDVLGDYTEATFTGYSETTLSSPSVVGARITWAAITWTFSGTDPDGQTVYGVVIRDASSNLIWAKRFSSSVTVSEASPDVNYTPTFTL